MKKHVRWGQRVAGRGSQGGLLWGGDTWAETWIKRGSKSFVSLVGGASTPRALAVHVSVSPAISALSAVFIHQPPLCTYSRAGLALKLPLRPVPPASSCLKEIIEKASGDLSRPSRRAWHDQSVMYVGWSLWCQELPDSQLVIQPLHKYLQNPGNYLPTLLAPLWSSHRMGNTLQCSLRPSSS